MSKTLKIILIVVGVLIVSCALFTSGLLVGGATGWLAGLWPARAQQLPPAPGLRLPFFRRLFPRINPYSQTQPGAPDGYQMMPGRMGPGMMGGYPYSVPKGTQPLTVDQARQAVETYLKSLNNPDLSVGEVMVFDNNAYVMVDETSTGMGAMELLVDPVTQAVSPEPGPNMMWNLKYGMMNGPGMMGGYAVPKDVSPDMPVTPEQAVQAAQRYLDSYQAGTQVEQQPDKFYGYYTLHILKDGQVVGMLSVNGFNSQVFPHTWHGNFIEMSE
jgi:hypothetical protein